MSDPQPSAPAASRGSHRFTEVSADLFVGVAVIILYLAFVTVVFCGFSGYIARINLAQELSSTEGGLDRLFYLVAREEALDADLAASTSAIILKTREIGETQAAQRREDYAIFSVESEKVAEFSPASLLISENSAILTVRFVDSFRAELFDQEKSPIDRLRRLSFLVSTPEFVEGADPQQVADVVERLRAVAAKAATYDAKLLEAQARAEAKEGEVMLLKSERDALEARRVALVEEAASVRAEPIFAYKAVVVSYRPILWELFYWLIQIPTIILTMVVTIASGGLGSVVSFTRSFLLSDATVGRHQLFVSVGEGVAAAVAIFFLAGAGLLMLTNGGGDATAGAEISPYMVAFIAFVSGFMAEDAFKSIQRAGRNLFKGPAE